MKKQIIRFLLITVMVLSILSTTVFAGEAQIQEPIAEEEVILQETEAIEEPVSDGSDNIEQQTEAPAEKITGPFYSYQKTVNADGTETRTAVQELSALPAGDVPEPLGIKLTDKDIGRVFDKTVMKQPAFIIEPGESADYQLHLVRPKGHHAASYMSNDMDFIEMTVFNDKYNKTYENYYLKPGYFYQILFWDVSQVKFTKDPVEPLKLDEKKDTSQLDSFLYKFTAPQRSTYEFSVQAREQYSNVYLYKAGYLEPMSVAEEASKSKSLSLKAGEVCYAKSSVTDWLTVSKAPDKDFAKVDGMRLQNSLDDPIDPVADFSINQSTGKAVVRSSMKKPWYIIGMNKDSNSSTPILTNSSGKEIKWTYDGMGVGNKKIYGVQLGIEGSTRNYKLTVVPESGDKSKAKIYSIAINPKPSKPTGFKATASSKSNAITLTWKESTDATGYKIYRADTKSGKYYFLKTISSAKTVKYNDKNLEKGKTYYYKLIPYLTEEGKSLNGTASNTVSATVKK